MTPIPSKSWHGEVGHAEGTFLRKLTMVCLIALVFSGLVVYWIGQTAPPRTADHPPAAHLSERAEDNTARPDDGQAHRRQGGEGCGR